MDAQQRVLLEGCWEALGHSALSAAGQLDAESAKAVGVSVGISYNEYYLNSTHQGMTAYTATSGTLSVVCGRISFTLGLKVGGLAGWAGRVIGQGLECAGRWHGLCCLLLHCCVLISSQPARHPSVRPCRAPASA